MTRGRAIAGVIAIAIAAIAWFVLHGHAGTAIHDDAAIATAPRARIKALLHPDAGAIAGTVTTAGKPLAGATVCARDHEGSRLVCAPAAPTYELADLPPGGYDVWASAPGFVATGPKDPVRVGSRARVALDLALVDAGMVVGGTVRDVRGAPIAGATVRVGTRDAPRFTATTAADGGFRAWAPPGDIFVVASADGFVDAEADGVAPTDAIAIAMTPESILAGTVVKTGTHEPVADATVSAGGETAQTDAAGHFAITKVRPGRYKPTATAIGGYGEVAESVRVALGQRVDGLVIELHPVAAVIGAVMIDDGKPCPPDDGNVWLSRYGSAASYSAKTIAEGTIVLEGVVPGTYEVSASCKGFLPQLPYPDLVVGDSDVDNAIWKVARGANVTGRVLDQAGAPIAEATVSHRDAGGTLGGSVTVAPDGTFAITGAMPGVVELTGYAVGFLRTAQAVHVTAALGTPATATLVLARGGGIAGTVADATGKPAPNVRISASGPGDSGDARSDRTGAFEIPALAPGTYDVTVDLDWGYYRETRDATTVKATVATGQTARVALRVDATPGSITGTVVDGIGAPVTDAYVEIALLDDRGRVGGRHGDPVLTDLAGGFTFSDLIAGSFQIRAQRRGGADAIASPVTSGSHPRLVMPQTGVLAGVVVTSTGAPVDDVTVSAEDRTRDRSREERLFHTGGRFALRELPAGKYHVSVDGDPRSTISVVLGDGERREDLRLVVQPRYTVRGRLVDASGRPLVGWKIEAPRLQLDESRENGAQITVFTVEQALTDLDGHFLVRNMPAGPLEISASDLHVVDAPTKVVGTPVLGGAALVIDVGDLRD